MQKQNFGTSLDDLRNLYGLIRVRVAAGEFRTPAGSKFAQHKKARAKMGRRQQQRFSGPSLCVLPAMSSTPGGAPFKEQVIAPLPKLLTSIFASSTAETVPSEEDITQLRKEVDDFIVVTRRQSARYQNHIDSLMARQGPETVRRREVQKNNAAQHAAKAASKHEERIAGPHSPRYPANARLAEHAY